MDYKVRLKNRAAEFIVSQPRPIQRMLIKRLEKLALDPKPKKSKVLDENLDIYKLTHKNYRILYRIRDKKLEVLVATIGKGIYTKDLFVEIIESVMEKRSSSK